MIKKLGTILISMGLVACGSEQTATPDVEAADMILMNGHVYSLSWDEPSVEGVPAANAPYSNGTWTPDGEAVAIKDGNILAVGTSAEIAAYKNSSTKVVDLKGAYALPGIVDSHAHIGELGATFDNVDLFGVETEEEVAERVVRFIAENNIPKGEWIVARGYDEGKWADKKPTYKIISEAVPDHPVYVDGATGFSAYGNKLAMIEAGIVKGAEDPVGGIMVRDENGEPTGEVRNRGVTLYRNVVPELNLEQWKRRLTNGLRTMADSGFTAIHDAGVNTPMMDAYESLAVDDTLPIRVYAMISGRDKEQMEKWRAQGPKHYENGKLFINSVKGYYDGSLGARGAKMIEEYADQPGHHGVAGVDYGFFVKEIGAMVQAGFQVNIHAIGDGANREVLHFFRDNYAKNPELQKNRHRIEHAQVVHPDDFKLYDELDIVAAVQPPFVAEDKLWTVDRVGEERAKGAYAWRTFRRNNVPLSFGSDLMGYDWNIFYGLHSAITRKSKELEAGEGWFPDEKLTAEEALRGYTIGAAYASHLDEKTGTLETGKWADITVVDMDVLNVGNQNPAELFNGNILMTIVGGDILYQK
ncbi:amidohydrolase [Pseudemcibacter aquimaris]|uniref:amidohydrolase n=1 Tax=Pseudemcibacter aquimaris TaxID=2857064 RepID=UPI002011BD46|nr:amidohydrolase [Pseudemcibacter aquimaris]MCC3862143.1 amidohydrolase [Pseudemcibacter aquimaris]WDU58896.1 amidohydrolase [Pseudemcibacter aquimaris]